MMVKVSKLKTKSNNITNANIDILGMEKTY